MDVSVDIFGYAATVPEAPGIGQNFLKISENVDVISSMIYKSLGTRFDCWTRQTRFIPIRVNR